LCLLHSLPIVQFSSSRSRFSKNRVDAAGNLGHYGRGRNGNETGHQSVLDQVLSADVAP